MEHSHSWILYHYKKEKVVSVCANMKVSLRYSAYDNNGKRIQIQNS